MSDVAICSDLLEHLLYDKHMNISTSAFANGAPIPKKYTCDGEDINPTLSISGVHPDAKSLVLIMDDPDASVGTWIHWVVWNIHPRIAEIPEDSVPEDGIEGRTSFGKSGYGGPCPHQGTGTHRYFFKLYELDTLLNIPLTSDVVVVQEAMKGHVIGDAVAMGTYSRD